MDFQTIDLSTGGVVVAIAVKPHLIPEEMRRHPALITLEPNGTEFNLGQIPPNTKAVLITDGLEDRTFDRIASEMKRRSIVHVTKRNPDAIRDQLSGWLKSAPKPQAVSEPERGAVTRLALEADLKKGSAEEGRRLFDLAKARGITTTLASLTQSISKRKREGGLGDRPQSAMPKATSMRLQALKVLDEGIASLQIVREWVSNVEEENLKLKAKVEKMKRAMEDA